MRHGRRIWLMPSLVAGLFVAMLLSLLIGSAPISPLRLVAALLGRGDAIAAAILFELRLPRTVLGIGVGAILGLAGAVLQGYLRNPLAEPSILGTSNAAALGAVAVMYFGLAQFGVLMLPLVAILAALLALALLFLLAGRVESPLTLILAGIAVGTLAGAGISLSLNLSPNPFAAMEIMTWLMGSLENRAAEHVFIAVPCIVVGTLILLRGGRVLDALTLGEDGARAMGFELAQVKWRLLIGVAIGVGGAVAVSGAIGFVGLIVPHIIRPLTDRSPSAILLPSLLAGGILLTLADVLVRIVPTHEELKLGVVTAFLGVPVFLIYLMRERRLW